MGTSRTKAGRKAQQSRTLMDIGLNKSSRRAELSRNDFPQAPVGAETRSRFVTIVTSRKLSDNCLGLSLFFERTGSSLNTCSSADLPGMGCSSLPFPFCHDRRFRMVARLVLSF